MENESYLPNRIAQLILLDKNSNQEKTLITDLFTLLFFSTSQSFSESMFMDYAFSDDTKPSIHIHFSNVGKDALYSAQKTTCKSKHGKIEKVKSIRYECFKGN